jgi:hypothetical protein
MSNIYCSQCGSKHSIGAKFCSSCGNQLSSLAQKSHSQNVLQKRSSFRNEDTDEDGLPTSFVRPSRLAYEIDAGPTNKYRGEDIFKAPQSSEQERGRPKLNNYKKLSKEELLSQSLKECAPRQIQDIDET